MSLGMGQAGSAVRHTTPISDVSGGTNNLPPILFHQVHGDNIRISRDGTVARRDQSFCKGITFSNRPINVAEKVCIKFLEVSDIWSGAIRFGFTSNDPNNLRCGLPEYAIPNLIKKHGYWAKNLPDRFEERGAVLFYYVTQAGDVHFAINGEEKGVLFRGVDIRGPLWALIDVYGNSTAIQLVDPRQQLNNSRLNLATGIEKSPGEQAPTERLTIPSLVTLLFNQENHQQPQTQRSSVDDATTNDMPDSRIQQPGNVFNPLPFHTTHGRNIRLSNDRCIASRAATDFRNGYVFTARPIQLGEKVVIEILATNPMYVAALSIGLTSCDPAMIQGADLPDDSDLLLDRPEYWVITNNVASCPQQGDELSFCVTHNGEVQFSKNGSTPVVLMHVDQTIQLWAFFDVCGSTQKVRILGSCVEPHNPHTFSGSRNSSPPPTVTDPALQSSQTSEHVHLQPTSSGTLLSTYSHTNVEPVSATSYSTLDSTVTTQQSVDATAATGGSENECTVCFERPIDSALYTCGHMCMCYECAVQQWRGTGGGYCPLCRAVIRDVLRTYKS